MAAKSILLGGIAVVTGGGSGIGRAVCQILARDGARVAVVDVNEKGAKETLNQLNGEHMMITGDISKTASATQLVADVQSHFNEAPSILVNSAGITRDKYMLKMTEQQWDEVIDVNLKGSFLMMQAVGKVMAQKKVKNGSIVNVASIIGKTGNPGQVNYSASKAGVMGMTKSAAQELAKFGIRCNAVLPGFINTPMTDAVPDDIIETIKWFIPMKRTGTPEEVAETIAFLSSSKSSYITGACIEVTGGLYM
ncbi:estradiol 17-beta-dehydrogenase 8-like [Lineus longissimus]|uniref:estradiol 17-beta-dehydrogenase 8-like n=1 Tax=Lineus longissimus TaxID=88925 RepID=UPI002B4E520D